MTEWVVVQEGYGFSAMKVIKRTAKQVVAMPDKGFRHERHLSMSQVLAFLPEERAKAMTERLVSSEALATEERTKAITRHRERVERIKAEFQP